MKKILIVDNDRILLGLMSRFLKKKGYQVVAVENGLGALDALKTYIPDIIFIDLVMPNIDGKSLCRIIRATDKFKDVYLVILSAISAEKWLDINKLGVNACIAKGPFDDMSQHITDVLDQPETTSERCLSGEILGVQGVYPRGITQELLLVKRHFEIILDKMSEGVIEINSEGRIVFANSTFISMLDISEKSLLGSKFIDLFSGDEHKRIYNLMENTGKKTKKISENHPLQLNQYHIAIDILSLDEDKLTSLIIIRDVTERKKMEDVLRENEEKYRSLIEKSDDIIWTSDLDLCTLYVSPAVEKKLGFTPEERMVQDLDKQVTPSSYAHLTEILAQELIREQHGDADPNRKIIVEVEYYHKNGSTLWFENIASGVRDSKGLLIGIHGISRDITDRKKSENELRLEKDKLQDAITKIKKLSGLLPICASCKKIRDDKGYWNQIESYIRDHSDADFTHGYCPECEKKIYQNLGIKKPDSSDE